LQKGKTMKKQAFNPFLPSYEYIPDGEPYVFGNRVYIYGSHDAFKGHHYCVNDYVCWSAPVDNLGDWRYEGVILKPQKDPLYNLPGERRLYAPDVQLGADGKYYLFYAFDELGVISVAVCDKPAGEYEFYGHVHYPDGMLLGKKEGDIFQFDPGVYREGERVYLYSGFCPFFPWKPDGTENGNIQGPIVVELEPDMLTVKTEPKVILPWIKNSAGTGFEGHEFFEAPSMRKIGEKYYFIYSSVVGSALCYAISDYPDRDFKFGGVLVSNGDIFMNGRTREQLLNYVGNNHGSIVEANGEYYIFYHRHTHKSQFCRQACAERIQILPDGSIPQVEITSCGLNNGPLAGKGTYEARIACNLLSGNGAGGYGMDSNTGESAHPYFTQEGEDREDNPNQYIANMCDGAVAGFKYFNMTNASSVSVKVRSCRGKKGSDKKDNDTKCADLKYNGKFKVYTAPSKDLQGVILNPWEHEKYLVAEIVPGESADYAEYSADFTDEFKNKPGVYALYFNYCGEGACDFISFALK